MKVFVSTDADTTRPRRLFWSMLVIATFQRVVTLAGRVDGTVMGPGEVSSPRRLGARWTTRWPSPPSGRSRTNPSAGKDRGATTTRSNWQPSNGSSASTPNARTTTSTTSPPRPSRSSTTIPDAPHQERGDSTKAVCGLTAAGQPPFGVLAQRELIDHCLGDLNSGRCPRPRLAAVQVDDVAFALQPRCPGVVGGKCRRGVMEFASGADSSPANDWSRAAEAVQTTGGAVGRRWSWACASGP